MKFNTVSGRLAVSSTHVPGRGSGILLFSTGSQAEFEVACSLNLPVRVVIFVCVFAGWDTKMENGVEDVCV